MVPTDDLRNDCTNLFCNHADLMLAIDLQIIGNSAKLLHLGQSVVQGVDVGLPAPRTVCIPAITDGVPGTFSDRQDIRWHRCSDAYVNSVHARSTKHQRVALRNKSIGPNRS